MSNLQALLEKTVSITITSQTYTRIFTDEYISVLACTDMGKFSVLSHANDCDLDKIFALLLKMRNDRESGIYPK
jgi:hypothetical protein